MNKESKIELLDIYEVRSILASRGVSVPLGKEGYETIIKNGFTFDMTSYKWTEKPKKESTE